MNCWPIVVRELRAESRRRVNYLLRLVAGTTVTFLSAVPILALGTSAKATGNSLFAEINWAVFVGLWLLVPFLTADSLSKEKREGTLGLLLLTPMTAIDVVIGKCLVHALRALSALLAVFPVMAIALLFGGISGADVWNTLAWDLGALVTALGAGLLGSSITRKWTRAILISSITAAVFGLAYSNFFRGIVSSNWPWRFLLVLVISLALFALILLLAAEEVRRTWKDRPRSRRQIWWNRTLFSPRFWRARFRRSMQEKLDRNPIAWLHDYSATERVMKWVWCLLAVLLESFLWSGASIGLVAFESFLGLVVALTAASSFHRERQNGIMELLLVSPLSEKEILFGRAKGLWSQFWPALVILELPWIQSAILMSANGLSRDTQLFALPGHGLLIATTFASLIAAGLYFAVRSRTLIMAWSLTCLFGILVPGLIVGSEGVFSRGYRFEGRGGVVLLYQFLLFAWAISSLTDSANGQSAKLFRERRRARTDGSEQTLEGAEPVRAGA
jgi:ABC-type transport system involved in multi-copper enzyme maturation permease subunit